MTRSVQSASLVIIVLLLLTLKRMMKQILLGFFKRTEAAVVCGSAVNSSTYFSSCHNRVLGKSVLFSIPRKKQICMCCVRCYQTTLFKQQTKENGVCVGCQRNCSRRQRITESAGSSPCPLSPMAECIHRARIIFI